MDRAADGAFVPSFTTAMEVVRARVLIHSLKGRFQEKQCMGCCRTSCSVWQCRRQSFAARPLHACTPVSSTPAHALNVARSSSFRSQLPIVEPAPSVRAPGPRCSRRGLRGGCIVVCPPELAGHADVAGEIKWEAMLKLFPSRSARDLKTRWLAIQHLPGTTSLLHRPGFLLFVVAQDALYSIVDAQAWSTRRSRRPKCSAVARALRRPHNPQAPHRAARLCALRRQPRVRAVARWPQAKAWRDQRQQQAGWDLRARPV